MAAKMAIGDYLDITLGGGTYTIVREAKYRYVASGYRREDSAAVPLGTFSSYAKAYDAVYLAAVDANMIPSTARAIENATYAASHANTATARKFWSLRLNRMRLVP